MRKERRGEKKREDKKRKEEIIEEELRGDNMDERWVEECPQRLKSDKICTFPVIKRNLSKLCEKKARGSDFLK